MTKRERQGTIREIIGSQPVESQETLRRLLRQRGWDVTQSTLSRDLRELRIARIPNADGGASYATPDAGAEGGGERSAVLDGLLPQLFVSIDGVGELAVLRTIIAGAQPIAVALDSEAWPDILGTIAGDDTVLIICRSSGARERVMRRLKSLGSRE